METFPSVLTVHMRRFVFEDWVPRKLAVRVDVPQVVDLERAKMGAKVDDSQQLKGNKIFPAKFYQYENYF